MSIVGENTKKESFTTSDSVKLSLVFDDKEIDEKIIFLWNCVIVLKAENQLDMFKRVDNIRVGAKFLESEIIY